MTTTTLRSSPHMKAQAARFAAWRKSEAEITEALARVQANNARREAWRGSGAANGNAGHLPQPPGQPTPERLAKLANGVSSEIAGKGEYVPLRRYTVRSALDSARQHLEAWECDLVDRFIADAELVTRVNVTSQYEGFTSRGTGRSRLGGIGNVSDEIRARYTHHEMVKRKLGLRFLEAAAWILLQSRSEQLGRPLALHEIGNRYFPTLTDKATTRGISLGLLKGFIWELEKIERYERVLSRQPPQPRRVVSITTMPGE